VIMYAFLPKRVRRRLRTIDSPFRAVRKAMSGRCRIRVWTDSFGGRRHSPTTFASRRKRVRKQPPTTAMLQVAELHSRRVAQ
jgi:hypothetical protein